VVPNTRLLTNSRRSTPRVACELQRGGRGSGCGGRRKRSGFASGAAARTLPVRLPVLPLLLGCVMVPNRRRGATHVKVWTLSPAPSPRSWMCWLAWRKVGQSWCRLRHRRQRRQRRKRQQHLSPLSGPLRRPRLVALLSMVTPTSTQMLTLASTQEVVALMPCSNCGRRNNIDTTSSCVWHRCRSSYFDVSTASCTWRRTLLTQAPVGCNSTAHGFVRSRGRRVVEVTEAKVVAASMGMGPQSTRLRCSLHPRGVPLHIHPVCWCCLASSSSQPTAAPALAPSFPHGTTGWRTWDGDVMVVGAFALRLVACLVGVVARRVADTGKARHGVHVILAGMKPHCA